MPKIRGVIRVPDNEKALMIFFDERPTDDDLRVFHDEGEPSARPENCRNRLRDEGKGYPKSGCGHCGTGGRTGCPYEPKGTNGEAL